MELPVIIFIYSFRLLVGISPVAGKDPSYQLSSLYQTWPYGSRLWINAMVLRIILPGKWLWHQTKS
ncbi:hypothetical protein NL529_30565, partial [Klebsiella pneumoniae]|nr:hypothetical protein [Klebsiella pneumoniae]